MGGTDHHFVSASCGDPCSVCGERSTHKLGEEVMLDEPCMQCGKPFVSEAIDPEENAVDKKACPSLFHLFGPGSQRHNLTAYVCCKHFTMIVGKASGCPTT